MDLYGYYPHYRERSRIRHPDFIGPYPYEVDRVNRRLWYFDVPPSYHLRGFYESEVETTQDRFPDPKHSDKREDEFEY